MLTSRVHADQQVKLLSTVSMSKLSIFYKCNAHEEYKGGESDSVSYQYLNPSTTTCHGELLATDIGKILYALPTHRLNHSLQA